MALFQKGSSGNPGGRPRLQPDLDRASKLLTPEQREALGLKPDQPMTAAQLRALWWATVVPIVAAALPVGSTTPYVDEWGRVQGHWAYGRDPKYLSESEKANDIPGLHAS